MRTLDNGYRFSMLSHHTESRLLKDKSELLPNQQLLNLTFIKTVIASLTSLKSDLDFRIVPLKTLWYQMVTIIVF